MTQKIDMEELARLSKQIGDRLTTLKAKKQRIDNKIIRHLNRQKLKALQVADGRVSINLTQGSRTEYDVTGFQVRLPPKVYRQIISHRIDPGALNAAISEGLVDPETVAACSSVKWNEPYLRITIND